MVVHFAFRNSVIPYRQPNILCLCGGFDAIQTWKIEFIRGSSTPSREPSLNTNSTTMTDGRQADILSAVVDIVEISRS